MLTTYLTLSGASSWCCLSSEHQLKTLMMPDSWHGDSFPIMIALPPNKSCRCQNKNHTYQSYYSINANVRLGGLPVQMTVTAFTPVKNRPKNGILGWNYFWSTRKWEGMLEDWPPLPSPLQKCTLNKQPCFCQEGPDNKGQYLCWVQTSRMAFPHVKHPGLLALLCEREGGQTYWVHNPQFHIESIYLIPGRTLELTHTR